MVRIEACHNDFCIYNLNGTHECAHQYGDITINKFGKCNNAQYVGKRVKVVSLGNVSKTSKGNKGNVAQGNNQQSTQVYF